MDYDIGKIRKNIEAKGVSPEVSFEVAIILASAYAQIRVRWLIELVARHGKPVGFKAL